MKWPIHALSFDASLLDETPGQKKLQRNQYSAQGPIAVVDQGQKLIGGYCTDEALAYTGPLPVIVFGDHTLALKYIDFPFILGADGVRVLSAKKLFEPKYLFYYLLSKKLKSQGYARHFKLLRELTFPLIPLSEQRRILDLLEQADELRRKRSEADEITAQILSSLFRKMFGDPVTNPNKWAIESLGRSVRFMSGGTPSKANSKYWEGEIPWVSPKDMKAMVIEDTEDHISKNAIKESATTLIPKGSAMIVVRSGILAHSVPVAMAGKDMAINQDLKALITDPNKFHPVYVLAWLISSKNQLLSCVKRGATVHSIDTGKLQGLPFITPPISTQNEFACRFEKIMAITVSQVSATRNIENLYQTMLHRAFTGELTAGWREAHMKELLAEMELQSKALNNLQVAA